jgi:hypothetical protein
MEKGKYPGYGIIYPQKSKKGLKVVRVWTDGPKRVRHADGSVEMLEPAPTIYELVGGAFCYGSGQIVNKRSHLENLPETMREKALAWFDAANTAIPKEAIINAPPPKELKPPEPNWVRSDERPDIIESVGGEEVDEESIEKVESDHVVNDKLEKMLQAIGNLTSMVMSQGDRIANLEVLPKKLGMAHKKQSATLKERWKDPAFRERMRGGVKKQQENTGDGNRQNEAV